MSYGDIPLVAYYRGKRVDDMTREELIDTVKTLGRDLNENREAILRCHRFYSAFMLSRQRRANE